MFEVTTTSFHTSPKSFREAQYGFVDRVLWTCRSSRLSRVMVNNVINRALRFHSGLFCSHWSHWSIRRQCTECFDLRDYSVRPCWRFDGPAVDAADANSLRFMAARSCALCRHSVWWVHGSSIHKTSSVTILAQSPPPTTTPIKLKTRSHVSLAILFLCAEFNFVAWAHNM